METVVACLAAVLWGTSDFIAGVFARRVPVTTVLIWSKVFGMALALPVAAFRGLPPRPGLAVAAGLVGLPAMGLLYRAMRDGSLTVVAPVAAVAALVPLGWGLAGGERFGAVGAVGVAVALLGVTLASWPVPAGRRELARPAAVRWRELARPAPMRWRELARPAPVRWRELARRISVGQRERAGLSALGAALGFGAYFVLLHEAGGADPYQVAAVARISGGAGALVLAGALAARLGLAGAGRLRPRSVAVAGALIAIGAFDATGDAAFTLAARGGALGPAALLASMYPAVTVLLNHSVLRERIPAVHLCGVLAALFAVACLAG